MEDNKNKSIFLSVLDALRGNKKDPAEDLTNRNNLLTSQPASTNSSFDNQSLQQRQQDFLDLQSLKVGMDINARATYYDADRISSYNDFRAMDQTPEISVAMDIISDECIAFDTIIPLLNGEKITIEELYKNNKNNFWVYSYNTNKKCIEPAICEKIVYKGEQNVYKVIFNDDSFVKVTDEHLWLSKSNREYIKTKDLKIGDSIQPFYTKISNKSDIINGYEMLLEDNGKWEYTHRIIKRKINPDQKGVCHHKDFNKLNNEPENLQVMNYFDHQRLHASLNSERWNNEEFANKMRKIFSETNSSSGPYWTNDEWRSKRSEQARITTSNFQSKLSDEEKKQIYGLPGNRNGMYQNGDKLIGEKNGRYKHELTHEFTFDELINAYKKTDSIDDACCLLNTNQVILRKSDAYKNLKIDRWEDLNILLSEINFKNIHRECDKYKSEFILERNFNKICKINNWKPKVVTKFLQKNGYHSWVEYVKQFDSRNQCINYFKKLYLEKTKTINGKVSFDSFCNQHGLSQGQVKGAISRSKFKNWLNFISSINHSIKEIIFIGKEKTYDLINVSENNNYAILTNNGTGVFVHNCVTRSDRSDILTIYSEDTRIKKILKNLFYDTLNIDFNLWFWIRELLKYGDNFLRLDIDQRLGIYDIVQLPTGEIDITMGDKDDPRKILYNWKANNLYFEEFQIAHFSLVSDGRIMPYGRSILDPARKLWKQLQLAEDAMLVNRLVRAPERRIFYLDVGNSDPADIKQYIESMKRELKKSTVVDQRTGNVNLKFNLMPVWSQTPIPLLDGRTITIEELSKELRNGKTNYVYSIQDDTHKIVPGKVVWCDKNYTANELIKVWLDDNTWTLTAPEHPFVLRDGSSIKAEDLKEGMSLMPLYIDEKIIYKHKNAEYKYTQAYNPSSGKFEFVHRLVSSEISKSNHKHNTIHHKDYNRYNNNPTNLEWVDFHEHRKLHGENARKNITKWNKNKDKIERVSKSNLLRNSIQHVEWYNTSALHKEHNKQRSQSMIEMWNNVDRKNKAKNSMKISFNNQCFEIAIDEVRKLTNFISADKFILLLKNNIEFIDTLKSKNKNTKRDLLKMFHRHKLLKSFLVFLLTIRRIAPA